MGPQWLVSSGRPASRAPDTDGRADAARTSVPRQRRGMGPSIVPAMPTPQVARARAALRVRGRIPLAPLPRARPRLRWRVGARTRVRGRAGAARRTGRAASCSALDRSSCSGQLLASLGAHGSSSSTCSSSCTGHRDRRRLARGRVHQRLPRRPAAAAWAGRGMPLGAAVAGRARRGAAGHGRRPRRRRQATT